MHEAAVFTFTLDLSLIPPHAMIAVAVAVVLPRLLRVIRPAAMPFVRVAVGRMRREGEKYHA